MKKSTAIMLLALSATMGYAQKSWIDMTDSYIVNPRFDNNDITTGWSGTQFGAASPKENAEHYSKTFNTYQEVSGLKAGTYRLSLNAFYRMGSSTNDYSLYTSGNYASQQYAKLYATSSVGEYEVSIVPASSAALNESLGGGVSGVGGGGWWGGGAPYIPNNMEAAYYWFEAGHYDNSVECKVGADGLLTIGIRKRTTINDDWTCIDNWKLEYYGEVVNVTSVTLSETDVEIVRSETYDLVATVLPSDATYRNVSWSSSNTSVATVDDKGTVTATGKGTCYITATSKSNSSKFARCKVTVTENIATAENIVINEIMAANVDVYMDPSFNYGSWVELYNPTANSVILGGLYISDNPANLKKHRLIDSYGALPAHGYALLNFDHHENWTYPSFRQIDDDLDCDGGTIIISDGETILAQQDYPQAISRTSYARTTDGGDTWGVTGTPSPGSSNEAKGGFATIQLAAPQVDKDAQLFTGSMQVCVNIPEGATLKYTTDGTTPSLNNGQVSETGLFTVSNSCVYRFRLFQDGYLPSTVTTRTYIYNNNNYHFPVISVVTDPNHLYSTEYGVFESGPNGRTGRGPQDDNTKHNWNMEWDRPVSFEYITTDNECIVSQECNFSMCGGWSRAWTPHSFKLKANKVYDLKNFFSAQFFDKKPYIKNKTLQIRNGGNDNGCRIKDPAVQMIVAASGLNVDYQEWQPVHVFINGEHYAVLNMREPNNKHFAYANYGIDTDEMDQFEMSPDSGYVQMEGTDEAYKRIVSLSENASDEDTYAEICKLIDIDEYINYMAVELYIGGTDWPQNNVKGFRDTNDGKFRFVLFDLDFVGNTSTPFDTFFGKEHYTFDALRGYDFSKEESIEGKRNSLNIDFVTLFKNMLKNDEFRKKFIDTYCIVGGSVFQPKYVQNIVSQSSSYLSQGGYVNPSWSANEIINKFNSSYNGSIINQMKACSHMRLSSQTRQLVNVTANVSGAKITLNDIEMPYSEFDGYLFSPVTLKASAPAGYRFVGWASKTNTQQKSIFNAGGQWSYYDQGSLDNMAWTNSTYSVSKWSKGNAPIGYGKNEATTTASNLTCYYFRKQFTLADTPQADDVFTLDFTVDDGAIVYVNGKEAGRYNMTSGSVTYSTVATSYAPGNPDTGSMTIASSLFKKGTNTIAVEVHNNQVNSSDILWDASLSLTTTALSEAGFVSTDAEYTLPSSGSQTLTAVFEAISDEEMTAEGITPVRVNEVSAANSMYINDYFKKNDWVELYNTTDNDIDLAGMFISDNIDKPEKYQVPSDDVTLNTIIPANGYKVVWCDKLDNKGGDIHTSFKLAAEGGKVMIKTAAYSDTLTYDAHTGVQSYGRYPDGAKETFFMNHPTIGKANMLTSYDTLYIAPAEPAEPEIPDAIASHSKDGGISIAYTDGVINVKSDEATIRSVELFTTNGMKSHLHVMMRPGNKFATAKAESLPKGVYIIRVTTGDNEEKRLKVNIK